MNRETILEFTSAFPPAHHLTKALMDFDYRKAFHTFMDGVVIVCAVIAALATVAKAKWVEHDMSERTALFVEEVKEFSIKFYIWVVDVAVPELISVRNEFRSYCSAYRLASSV